MVAHKRHPLPEQRHVAAKEAKKHSGLASFPNKGLIAAASKIALPSGMMHAEGAEQWNGYFQKEIYQKGRRRVQEPVR